MGFMFFVFIPSQTLGYVINNCKPPLVSTGRGILAILSTRPTHPGILRWVRFSPFNYTGESTKFFQKRCKFIPPALRHGVMFIDAMYFFASLLLRAFALSS